MIVMSIAEFHEVLFPVSIALGATGGPQRYTEIISLGSGREVRNAKWSHSLRRYDAATGTKTFADLAAVIDFFEERRGRLCGFRWHDVLDDRSCVLGNTPTAYDQVIGTGDANNVRFQLIKNYGEREHVYQRRITKPVEGSVYLSVDGDQQIIGTDFLVSHTNGIVTFNAGSVPAEGAIVRAGFYYHVPVRFDTDFIEVDYSTFAAGEVASIPIIEVVV